MSDKVALLLEDEALIAMDVEQILMSEGFVVVSFARCSDGLDWLSTKTPTLAIVDIELYDGDCDEAAEVLTTRHVPFVVYSGAPLQAGGRPAFSAGRWLAKPSGADALQATIRTLRAEHPEAHSP